MLLIGLQKIYLFTKKGTREMNANELADDLESHLFAIGKERPFYEHAAMLRQQQAEIEVLKNKLEQYEILEIMITEKLSYLKAQEK
jgi:hypothetical protein